MYEVKVECNEVMRVLGWRLPNTFHKKRKERKERKVTTDKKMSLDFNFLWLKSQSVSANVCVRAANSWVQIAKVRNVLACQRLDLSLTHLFVLSSRMAASCHSPHSVEMTGCGAELHHCYCFGRRCHSGVKRCSSLSRPVASCGCDSCSDALINIVFTYLNQNSSSGKNCSSYVATQGHSFTVPGYLLLKT